MSSLAAPRSKTPCNVTRKEFAADAKPITATVADKNVTLEAKEFSTGSMGWHANGVVRVMVGGKAVECTMNVLLTIKNSKEAV